MASDSESLREVALTYSALGVEHILLGIDHLLFVFALLLLVPGLGWNCFEDWLDVSHSVPKHLASIGYEARTIPVDGLSSTTNNARMIRDYIMALPPEDKRSLKVLWHSGRIAIRERRGEIGLLRAIGAQRFQILFLFLSESAVLALLGGLIGLALGATASALLAKYAGWQTVVTSASALTASMR